MVLAFYKILALVLKVFSKPLIDRTKKVHLQRDVTKAHPRFRTFFIKLGNNYHYYDQWINQKFL